MLVSCDHSGALAMEEKRKHQRTEINQPAYVSAEGSVMRCVVRNISQEGAAIDVDNPAFVPARFRLVMASDSSTRDCAVIWIREKRIGVAFADPAGAHSPNS
jgi:PilZ domain